MNTKLTNLPGGLQFTKWQFNTCGMHGIAGFNYCHLVPKTDKEWEAWWNEYVLKGEHTDAYTKTGNFTFAVTDSQLRFCHPESKADKNSLLCWLVNRKDCRVIHSYKNNAHGSNTVVIFALHPHEKAVKLAGKNWGLSIGDWLAAFAEGTEHPKEVKK